MSFVKIFSPGMWLMRKMRFGAKLGILSAVVLLPLLFIAWQLIDRTQQDRAVTRTEMVGVRSIERIGNVMRLLQVHRGQTAMLLSGSAAVQPARDKTRSSLKDAEERLVQGLANSEVPAPAEWSGLQARLDGLFAQLDGKSASESFGLHTALVEDLVRLTYGVAEKSGLIYDPDPLTYLLMDMSVSRLVLGREQVGQLRGMGAGLLSQPTMSEAGAGQVRAMANGVAAWVRHVQYSQNLLAREGFNDPTAQLAQAAVAQFVQQTQERFRPDAPTGGGDAYFAAGTQAIDALAKYQDAVDQAMLDRLQAREIAYSRTLLVSTLSSALAVGLLVYLMLSFNVSFLEDLRKVMRFMEEMARGNLRYSVNVLGKDELADVSLVMHTMAHGMSAMVATVRSNAALFSDSGDMLVQGNEALTSRTEQQAANLEETSASVQELASNVNDNAAAALQADQAAQRVREVADQGAHAMGSAIASVEAIESSTKRMDEIVGVIDGLAFQTNILALNAAVEAARAGESGRGFAVVAAEVRTLAQRSAASAKEIRQLIGASSSQVAAGVAQIRAVGQNLNHIVDGVRAVAANMSQISASSADQSHSLSEITSAIRQLDQITQQNAAMVEHVVSQATGLQNRSRFLSDAVARFQLQQGSADEARLLVDRALELRQRAGSRDAFLREVTAAHSGLFDRDMYVFVLDRVGHYLAFGGNPAKVGTRVQDVPGIDGDALVASIVEKASEAPGWVEYDIVNPLSGKVQTKMSYVQQVDDVFVGCGVYKNLVTVG